MDDLFNVNFSALQDNEPIDISEVVTEDTAETAETVEVVDDQTAEQKPEDSTAEAETTEKKEIEQPEAQAQEEDNVLIDIETDTTSEEDNTPEPPGQEDSSPITPFASLLQDQGFLPHANIEDIKSTEDLIKAF